MQLLVEHLYGLLDFAKFVFGLQLGKGRRPLLCKKVF